MIIFLNEHLRWSIIAAQLPGRTDNDVKNHWNTKLKKKLSGMGIDPVTHKPISHLIAEITNTLAPPQVAHLAEAALGCFKDEMLHLLTKKRIDFQLHQSNANAIASAATLPPPPPAAGGGNIINNQHQENDDTIQKIKLGLSRAIQIQQPDLLPQNKLWDSHHAITHGATTFTNFAGNCSAFGFQYGPSSFSNEGDGSPWNQSMCTGSTCTPGDQQAQLQDKLDENGLESDGGKEITNGGPIMFNSDSVLWDLPSDDLMSPIV